MRSEDGSNCCALLCTLVGIPALVITVILLFATLGDRAPLYSAAIDSASGLDAADLRRIDLNPVFNLTLRVTARSLFSSGCTHPGAVAEVTYAGVGLATGSVPRFCARPTRIKQRPVLAWGTSVQVPGFALDRLAEDARNGVVSAFDVAVTMPSTHDSDHHGKLVSCTGLRAGDRAALRAPCVVSDVDMVMSVPSGKVDGPRT